MYKLTLVWQEQGLSKTEIITDEIQGKFGKTIKLGRDQTKADILFKDITVSGLNAEIYFHQYQQNFYFRNLRDTNPPMLDGQVIHGEVVINRPKSVIYLGQIAIQVELATEIEKTVVVPRPLNSSHPINQPISYQNQLPITPINQTNTLPNNQEFGLKCPRCAKVSTLDHAKLCCPWCGTSLAAAQSVIIY